ncbi:MAG: hypothetical protein IJS05_06125 [Paludibacteraceae bacterium]|nr:hypothetical protein [Paludibacteraceae bacterium]
MNIWIKILQWFNNHSDRTDLIMGFNTDAQKAFIAGLMPVLLQAEISRGCSEYKHSHSHWLYSGFRIKAFTGQQLSRNDIKLIGEAILNDDNLVRKLVVLGFDTLEVHCDVGNYGCRWQIKDFLVLGYSNNYNYLNNNSDGHNNN